MSLSFCLPLKKAIYTGNNNIEAYRIILGTTIAKKIAKTFKKMDNFDISEYSRSIGSCNFFSSDISDISLSSFCSSFLTSDISFSRSSVTNFTCFVLLKEKECICLNFFFISFNVVNFASISEIDISPFLIFSLILSLSCAKTLTMNLYVFI